MPRACSRPPAVAALSASSALVALSKLMHGVVLCTEPGQTNAGRCWHPYRGDRVQREIISYLRQSNLLRADTHCAGLQIPRLMPVANFAEVTLRWTKTLCDSNSYRR